MPKLSANTKLEDVDIFCDVLEVGSLSANHIFVGASSLIGPLEREAKAKAAIAWAAAHDGSLTGFDADWTAVQWPAITARMAK